MTAESYLPYHRKYRPKRIKDYIGNHKIKKGVLSALQDEHKPQVILMSGHAGTGKTTMGRLLAKEYLCSDRNNETGACGRCHNCVQMEDYIETGDADSLMNVREVDVTDSSGKQDITELLEDASIPTYDGSWKVYILDECHMMTNAAQNRLLKNLEEPAERVLMILCTTDPQKLLETIISRCQYVWKVQKPSREELSELLQRVLINEGFRHNQYDAKALSLVCVKGDFVPRKALVALEQVVREAKEVTYDKTVEVLDVVSDRYFFEFYEILLDETINIYRYITFIGRLKATVDLKQFVDTLLSFSTRGIYIANGVVVEALDESEKNAYKKLFSKFSTGDVAHLLNLLLSMKKSLDVEARLLLLGYTGLKQPQQQVPQNTGDLTLVDISDGAVSKEKQEGSANYIESITMTEEEKDKFVEEHSKQVTPQELATLFGGTLLQGAGTQEPQGNETPENGSTENK